MNNFKFKVAFIHQEDGQNKKVFSGIPYHLIKELRKQIPNILILTPVIAKENQLLKVIAKAFQKIEYFITRKEHPNYYRNHHYQKKISSIVDKFIIDNNVDIVISTGVDPFVYSKAKYHLIQITGGTVKLLYRDYAGSKGWAKSYLEWLEKRSQIVIDKSELLICASKYCADSLLRDYNVPPKKISIIPYGANLEDNRFNFRKREINPLDKINFLFIGREWVRKGGDIAVNLCDELINLDYDISLFIVGCEVPKLFQRNYIVNYIELNKNIKEQSDILFELYRAAHFFIVPTRAEFFGVVFSEAAYFGLPVISTKVGAVPEIVIDDETGILMEREPVISLETERIVTLIRTPDLYKKMAANAKQRSEILLNWSQFVLKLKILIEKHYAIN